MALSPDHMRGDTAYAGAEPRLSTDYLNRYGEALMLLEMAADDPEMAQELRGWHAVSYREHFTGSRLRCASAALAAYEALPAGRRAGFDACCAGMTALVAAAVEDPAPPDPVTADIARSLREHIARATRFINANGTQPIEAEPAAGLSQSEIDSLFN